MPDMDLKNVILVAAFIAVAVVVFLIKEAINKKKGESGEDLAKVRQVIDKLPAAAATPPPTPPT